MIEGMESSWDAQIGTEETRKLIEALARGNRENGEVALNKVKDRISSPSLTDIELVDLVYCIAEWEKSSPKLFSHLGPYERTMHILAPGAWYLEPFIGALGGMAVFTYFIAQMQSREGRVAEATKIVNDEVSRRLAKVSNRPWRGFQI